MPIFEDLPARIARTQRPAPLRPSERAGGPGRPNQPPDAQALDESAIFNLQRSAGNAAVSALLSGGVAGRTGRKQEVGAPQPRLRVDAFSFDRTWQTPGAFADKSVDEKEVEQDQNVDVGTFTAAERGLRIVAEANGPYQSTEFPDGFKFTQTIETNAPLRGATSPYVDPHPNDDQKPFYWTDAEQERYPTTFRDYPKRNPPTGSAMKYWQATLALNGIDEAGKTVTGFDYLTYGFIMDAAGNIKLNYPANVDGENHRQTLAEEFSGWTFD